MNKKDPIFMAVDKRRVTIFVVILVFLAGAVCYNSLPKQQYPVVTLPMVIISAVYPGASAEDMEELVTSKLEDICMAADGFDYVASESYNSASVIKMYFDQDLNEEEMTQVQDDLRKDIENADLPDGVTSVTFSDDIFDTAGLILAFTGDGISNRELKQRAEELKTRLLEMQGVSDVQIEGDLEQQVKVTVDSAKANHLGVTLTNLAAMISAQNSTVPVGTLEFEGDEINVNTSGKLDSLEEIENIIVSVDASSGAVVKLSDIADVEMGVDDDSKRYSFNGEDAVILSLFFADGENVLDIGADVEKEIEDFRTTLSDGINMESVIWLPDDVSDSVNDFLLNLIESVIIVLAVVMIMMSIRNGAIVSVIIPLVIFASFICMQVLGVEINFISLASLILTLGMLVSNAIVVSDAIQVRIDNDEERMSACVNGTKEVALPVLTSTLTTVIIYSIFYMLPGSMREFAFPLPTIVISALTCSYIAALFVTPAMCYIFMKKTSEKKASKEGLKGFFKKLLIICLDHKAVTFIASGLCVAAAIALLASLDMELIPVSDKEILDIDVTAYNYYDIRKTEEVMEQIEEILQEEPENAGYLASTGGHVPKYDFGTQPATDSVNKGSVIYNIDLKQGGRFKTKAEYCDYLQSVIDENITGAKIIVSELAIVPAKTSPVSVTFYGGTTEKLNEVGNEAAKILENIDGTTSVHTDRKYSTYNYYIDMNNDELNTCGLTKSQVQYELYYAIMGGEATTYRKNGEEYPVVVKSNISNTADLRDYQFVSSTTGGSYKLSQFADVGVDSENSIISRYNGERSITVGCYNKNGKSTVEIANALKAEIDKLDTTGLKVKFQGDLDTFNTAMAALVLGAVLGSFIILFVLFVQFYSFKRVFIVLMSVPFAVIGSAIGLWATNQNLSMFAAIGMISLIGVVVNNAIVLLDYIDSRLKENDDIDTACVNAVDMRFRPILLSTATTVLGLFPLALFGNVIFKGLSIAFMSGLTTSLVFTLVIIPTICSALLKDKK
ncbi:MAG: efflux RND transporter permease subunit [Eubacterium sp.]|nr:efflux RND transporter permease subunit [Eubacterium sp.]